MSAVEDELAHLRLVIRMAIEAIDDRDDDGARIMLKTALARHLVLGPSGETTSVSEA